jgi:pyruvate dehydrogenase E1 component beta subunit
MGKDITLVSFNKMMKVANAAANALAVEGIEAEVIDLRTIRPCDYETIIQSVKKTNRCIIIDESWPFAGVSSEIAYALQRLAFDYLDAPVIRLNTADTSLGYSNVYVEAYLPQVHHVVNAAKEIMYIQK